jgi:hypothetical protein
MRIDTNGNVGIGTTNPTTGRLHVEAGSGEVGVFGFGGTNGAGVYGSSSSGYGVLGFSVSNYAGYFSGNVFVTGCLSASNLSCPSDARLKENITPLSYGLPEVLRLRPMTWQWKDPTKTEPNVGLIAQDVEPLLPELIIHNADNKG